MSLRKYPALLLLLAAVLLVVFAFFDHHSDRVAVQAPDQIHTFPNIEKSRADQIAMRDKLLGMFDPKNAASVFPIFRALAKNSALFQNCHEIGHDLGHKAYELYGFSGALLLNDPNAQSYVTIGEVCAGGYMHGVLEELLGDQPDLKSRIGNICRTVPDVNRASCFHGIGHGFMFLNQRHVPESIADCQTVGSLKDQTHCFEGVWMEMFWGDTAHVPGAALGWAPEQPLLPCKQALTQAKPACFLYANLGYLGTHSKDFTGAITLCSGTGLTTTDVRFCLKGTGMTMMQYFLNHHLSEPEMYVAHFDAMQRTAYYQGLIAYARLSNAKESGLRTFCQSLHNDQELCLSLLKTIPH